VGKIVVEFGRLLGKAFIAGVGMEIAKVAGSHLQKRLAPKDDKKKEPEPTEEELRAENDKLRAEVDRLREELATAGKTQG
jgi:hypothetical protein